jgi:predicted alpha/beta superfamily hydrolase
MYEQTRRHRTTLQRPLGTLALSWLCCSLSVAVAACGGAQPVSTATPTPLASCPPTPSSATAPPPALPSAAMSASSPTATSPTAAPARPLYPPLQLAGTQVRDLQSELTGKQHRFLIALPPSFESEPTRRYPVLYVLDGQWDFPLVTTLSGGLHYDQVLPEMLIVGLSWAGENPNYDALRSDDYLPTRAKGRDGVEKGGGAPNFLSVLSKDVIPLMEREYRADPERRVLAGASNGALFALYTLFEQPDLFWGYIAISPNVGWDDQAIFKQEAAFHAAHPALDRRLWLSSGSAERPDYLSRETAFFKQLTASRYKGIALKVFDVQGERHAGVKPEAYNRALRFIAEPLVAAPVVAKKP